MDDDGECTEETWWAAALTGDGEAFGQIFDRHHGRVYRHAVRLVDSRADVEDVVASTFLELWRRREDVRIVDGSALAWLLVTASNVARNMRRSRRRYSQLLAQLPRSPDVPDHAGEVIDRDVFGAISPTLAAGLRSLSQLDLHLVTLVALEGYPVPDAAELLGITPAAAKSRLHRARSKVRLLAPQPQTSGATP